MNQKATQRSALAAKMVLTKKAKNTYTEDNKKM